MLDCGSTNFENVLFNIGLALSTHRVTRMRASFQRFLPPAPPPSIIGDKIVKAATQITFLCLLWSGCGFVGTRLARLQAAEPLNLTGRVLDPQSAAVPGTKLRLDNSARSVGRGTTSDAHGSFIFQGVDPGNYILTAEASGFATISKRVAIMAGQRNEADLQFLKLAEQVQQVNVVVTAPAVLTPDPGQKILVHDEVLDANPGRAGAPISIPGLPIETASGGIKAPNTLPPAWQATMGNLSPSFTRLATTCIPTTFPPMHTAMAMPIPIS